ncbi:unnamed protein product [Ilex paraguariensis]|uniref:FAF domain-containing protein n=1 Tax=Ilex paraguariensis TaxID=185542 RepID=A0ABC8TYV1_9AQUA
MILMSFCRKSVHYFLGFSSSGDNETEDSFSHHRNISSLAGGLSLFTILADIQRPINVLESSTLKSTPPSPPTAAAATTKPLMETPKKDPGGIGFIDEVGGIVDGLMSCTESLGFESSDERRVDDKIDNLNNDELGWRKSPLNNSKWKRKFAQKQSEVKKFPPPLSSLNYDGKPNFFLRPVRKDGRLELSEVKIHSPKFLRASRQDGRLRLHLICDEDLEMEEQVEADQQVQEDEEVIVEEKVEVQENEKQITEEKVGENKEEKRDDRVEEWRFPMASSGGDGFRRCHEPENHHQYHLHLWRQHCVTPG